LTYRLQKYTKEAFEIPKTSIKNKRTVFSNLDIKFLNYLVVETFAIKWFFYDFAILKDILICYNLW